MPLRHPQMPKESFPLRSTMPISFFGGWIPESMALDTRPSLPNSARSGTHVRSAQRNTLGAQHAYMRASVAPIRG